MPIAAGEWSSSRKFKSRALHRAAPSQRRWCLEILEDRLYLSSAYSWQNVNIGGGGFVDGVFYDAHNANVIYARTDVGGLFKTVNDGGNWTQLLNWVGNNTSGSGNGTQFQELGVLSFAIDPENSNNLVAMVGMYSWANGDVLYSTTAGATWSTTPLSFWVGGNSDGRATGERIAVDPYDSNIILLGSNANGLWESTNAGQSFAQLTSLSTSASINFVYFDPYGGTAGTATQEIFVGENSAAGGTNLYESINGATSFTEITGTGSAPTGWMPNRTALASDGNLYLAYSNALTPDGDATNGGVFRYNTSTGAWANISPVLPQITNGQYDQFGYVGIALDPNSSTTLVVTSLDRYNFGDEIWRTTNANLSSPSWTTLYQLPQPNIYAGYDPTRDTTNAPYMASGGDGSGNWASDVAIDPFNSAQIMHTYGGGIWATNDGNSTSTLTAANSWYFPDTGIEMTAVLDLDAATGGTPLYSGMGDVGGFAFTTLAFSPSQGNVYPNGGNGTSVDSAGLDPQDAVLVGNMGATDGFYTTNGSTYTAFAANPGGGSAYSNGTVAESANASTIVWAPSGQGPYYSTNNGASWSATNLVAPVSSITQTGGVPKVVTSAASNFAVGQYVTISGATPSAYDGTYAIASIVNSTTFTYTDSNVTSTTTTPATGTITASLNGTVLADKVNPNYFYFGTENASDNSWTLYISSNGGQTFIPSGGGAIATGNATLVVNPTVAGQLWLGTYVGIYESTNFGAGFSHPNSYSTNVSSLGVGAAAPGSSYPAIYIYGTPVGDSFQGIYRSDDGGNTWLLLNDVNHQWGGTGPIAADPNIFGRVYLGAGGITMGNPATSLPSGWSDSDINEPGNPGWATSSTTLSTGSTVNQWTVAGGGAGFSSTPISITSLSRTGGVATAVTSTASGLQVGQTITIAGASNTAYDGQFVITGLYNTTAGLASEIGAATEFTFGIASGTDIASGTITATLNDQFNFAYKPVSGNAVISAQIQSLTNADASNGTPQAGIMYRAGTNPSDPFFAVFQNSNSSVMLYYRTTTGGGILSQAIGGIPVGSEYIEIVRNGNSFSGKYSSNGTTWTQLGATVTIAAMPVTANVGLAATANFNAQLTAATFANVLVVPLVYWDTSGNNTYAIDLNASNPSLLQIFVNEPESNTPTEVLELSQAPSLSFLPGSGNDSLTVDFANGNPVPSGGVGLSGGSGNNTLFIQGNAGPVNSTQVAISGGSGTDTLTVNGGTYTFTGDPEASTSSLTVNDNSAVVFAAGSGGINTLHLAGLNIGTGATAKLATAALETNRSLLITGGLSIAGTGLLDIGGNDMIVQGGVASTIFNDLKSGLNAGVGYWNGTSGIVSTAAAGDTTFLTTLGERVSDGSSFDGVTPNVGDVLVKYTLYGDADLNGVLNGADYQQIDNGFGNHSLSGWSNGDFNYNGTVDGSDYSLIDNAFNQETAGAAPLALVSGAVIATPSATVASARVFATTVPIVAIVPATTIGSVWSELEEDRLKNDDPTIPC